MADFFPLFFRSFFRCFFGVVFGHVLGGFGRYSGKHFRLIFVTFFDQKSSRFLSRFSIDFWMGFEGPDPRSTREFSIES